MPTKAAKSATAKPKARPTAVEILLSKINPTTTSKFTTSTIKYGNAKSATAKTNGLAKANNNGNGKATGAKANGNGKAEAKATAQARVNGNGKAVVEKKVIAGAKFSAEKKSGGNGKVTVVTKSSVTVEKKGTANGKATSEVKEIKMKVNGKPENKVAGEAKANGNGKIVTLVEKKVNNGAATWAKIQTTARATTEKVIKVEKIEKTVPSTTKSAAKLAAKPTKATRFESTTLAKATKAAGGKTQARAEVKESSQVTKVSPVKTTVPKAAKSVVETGTLARKIATAVPVRPTPPRPVIPKMATDVNVKSSHKPFPPFGKTFTAIPARKVTNGFQQVLRSHPVWVRAAAAYGPSVPLCCHVFPPLRTRAKIQMSVSMWLS